MGLGTFPRHCETWSKWVAWWGDIDQQQGTKLRLPKFHKMWRLINLGAMTY